MDLKVENDSSELETGHSEYGVGADNTMVSAITWNSRVNPPVMV